MKRILAGIGLIFATISQAHTIPEEVTDTVNAAQVSLQEVVVTTLKQPKDLHQLPIAASRATSPLLQHQNVQNIKDFSTLVPNLFAPNYGSKLTSPIYIRGIGSKINSPSVGLYVDGVPYFEKAAFDFDLNDVASIEVLRGPQGTLYGRNTMGGIINVYTKSPLHYQGSKVSIEAGAYGTYKVAAGTSQKLTEQLGLSFSSHYKHTDGYLENTYTDKKADKMDVVSASLGLVWQPTEDWKIRLSSLLDYSNQKGYPYGLYDAANDKVQAVNYNDEGSYLRWLSSTGLGLTYTGHHFSFSSQTSFQFMRDEQQIDQDFTSASTYKVSQYQKQRMFSEELTLKSLSNRRYEWLFGAFAFYQSMDREVELNLLAHHYSTPKTYDNPTTGVALYHQSTLHHFLFPQLSLTAGMRFDAEWAKTDFSSMKKTADTEVPLLAFNRRLSFGQWTPKVSLQYDFSKKNLLYATVTKGYKTGGFNTSFDSEADYSFDPEYSWNYELGWKGSWFNRCLTTSVSLFYIDWHNQQIYQTLATGRGSMIKNAGKSHSKGIEVSVQAKPFKSLNAGLDYGYTYAKFDTYVKNDAENYNNHFLPMVPRQTLSLHGEYLWHAPISGVDLLSLSMQYTGVGKVYWREDNKVARPYYGTLNAKCTASRGPLSVSLWAKNLTKTAYTAYYFEMLGKGFAQEGKPLTWGMTLAYYF
jgi:outer membrane receptor protein involved in Fe transport